MTQNTSSGALGGIEARVGPAQAYGMLALTVFLWAIGVVVARGVYMEIPPVGLSFWRWLLASLILLPFALPTLRRHRDVVRSHLPLLVVQGALMVGSGTILFLAVNYTTAINATMVNATQPVMTALLAWIMFRERLNRLQMLGVAAALVGVVVMVVRADWTVMANLDFNAGDLIVIVAIVGYSFYAINLRKLPAVLGIFPSLFVILFSGTILLLPIYVIETIYVRPVPFNGTMVLVTVVLALLVSILSMALWYTGNRVVGPNKAAMFVNLMPFYVAVMATSFLGERLYDYHFIGTALVCAGIFMVVRKR